jgi:hypothetical protein
MGTVTAAGPDGKIVPVEPAQQYPCNCFSGEPTSPRRRRGYIPYSSIYESQEEFRKSGYWIPELPIDAEIIKVEKDTSSSLHLVSPYVYTIQLEHGKFKWQVRKRYQDFSYLSNRLMAHRAVERIKAPVRRTQRHFVNNIYGREHKDGCPYKYSHDEEDDCTRDVEEESVEVYPMAPDIEFKEISISDAAKQDAFNQSLNLKSESEDDGPIPDPTFKPNGPRNLPHFPMVPDSMIDDAHVVDRKKRLELWLRSVLSIAVNRNYHETVSFFTIRFNYFKQEI